MTRARDLASGVLPGTWIDYTPTWTNLTVGNGTTAGRYIQIGKTVHVWFSFGFGSTTSVSGIFFPSLPVAAKSSPIGIGWAFDESTLTWNNFSITPGAYFISSGGSRYTATNPWTWASGDLIRFSITYEAA